MALAVDIMRGHGPSNKMHPQLQSKKTKVILRLYHLLRNKAAKGVIHAVYH